MIELLKLTLAKGGNVLIKGKVEVKLKKKVLQNLSDEEEEEVELTASQEERFTSYSLEKNQKVSRGN